MILDSANIILGGTKNFYFPFIRYTTNRGKNWTTSLLDNTVNYGLKDLQLPIKHIFNSPDNRFIAFTDSGYYYKTNDLINWKRNKLKVNKFRALQGASKFNNKIVLSYGNKIYFSDDFGDNWEQTYTADSVKNKYLFSEIQIIDEYTIYATGRIFDNNNINYLFISNDNGVTWEIIGQTPSFVNNLKFLNKNVGFYRRDNVEEFNNIYKTNDQGKNWEIIYQQPFDNFFFRALEINSKGNLIFANEQGVIFKILDNFSKNLLDSIYHIMKNSHISTLHFITENKILMTNEWGKTYIYIDEEDIGIGVSIENLPENNNYYNPLIFPNPSSDKISLDLGGVALADLVVYDILGNGILSIPHYTNKSEIDISTLSIGTYTIQIQTSTGSISQRFVKY